MMSELDRAHAALQDGGAAEGMAFYRTLANAELFLLLEAEAVGEVMTPRVFDLTEGAVLLAFDSEDRLAGFADGPQPYAALPGRVIAGQMVGLDLSLGLNMGSGSASEVILPPEALKWMVQMLDQAPPRPAVEQIAGFEAPVVPKTVLKTLPAALSGAERAYLVGVRYRSGRREQLLAVIGVAERDEARVARAVTEALAFSGIDAGAMDLAFVTAEDGVLARMAGLALVFEPAPLAAKSQVDQSSAGKRKPGPPILR